MPHSSLQINYDLVDFGDGRRLDCIDDYVLDRPCPAASGRAKSAPAIWSDAEAVFDKPHGWRMIRPMPGAMRLDAGDFALAVQTKPYGHLGFFPEQLASWNWLRRVAQQLATDQANAMNLFAYTGGSTLALASQGVSVAHVDSSKPSVVGAGDNARLSGLGEAPIRYIIDDARKFVAREQRRERQYDIITLDPPAYGHGTQGNAWKLERDLWDLLKQCRGLLSNRSAMLITGHSESISGQEIVQWMRKEFPEGLRIQTARATINDRYGKSLDAGYWVRATWNLSLDE